MRYTIYSRQCLLDDVPALRSVWLQTIDRRAYMMSSVTLFIMAHRCMFEGAVLSGCSCRRGKAIRMRKQCKHGHGGCSTFQG